MGSAFTGNLRRLMKERDLTQRELAEKIGVTDIRMAKLVTGEREPKPMEIANLEIVFHCTAEELMMAKIISGRFVRNDGNL